MRSLYQGRHGITAGWRQLADLVAESAKRVLGEVTVVAFGSLTKGEATAASDLDILLISPRVPSSPRDRAKLKVAIEEGAGLPPVHPVEVHLAHLDEVRANPIYSEALKSGIVILKAGM